MKLNALLALALLGGASTALANPVFDFTAGSGDIGPTMTYSNGGVSIVATGFNITPFGSTVDLFSKHSGPGETGLGVVKDPSDGEIGTSDFIQLDVSNLVAHGITSIKLGIGSIQVGEGSKLYASSTWGALGGSSTTLTSAGGLAQFVTVSFDAKNHFVDITGLGLDTQGQEGDVLILTGEATVPDSGTTALLLVLGLFGVGIAAYWRKATPA